MQRLTDYRAFAFLMMKELMHVLQMQSDVQGDNVLMSAPPFLMLWFVGFIPVQDDIIVQAARGKEGGVQRYCMYIGTV